MPHATRPPGPSAQPRLTIGAAAGDLPAARALVEAIPHRHTNRRPFASKPVPYGTLVELSGAATAENATLVTVDPALRAAVLSLTRTAENRMKGDPQYRAELASSTTPGGVGRRDGVPRQAFGPRDENAAIPLAATPLSQLLEVPKLRALLADAGTGQVVQSILRIGYATTPALATPRRPVEDVLADGET